MGRRRKHDVFVIGDELSEAETTVLEQAARPAEGQEPGDHPQPSGLGPPAPPGGRRALAVLAIAGPVGAALGVLASSLSTPGGTKDTPTSSSRSALVQGPAPRAVAPPAQPARPLPRSRHPESKSSGGLPAARRSRNAAHEPERETTPSQAPESSLLPVATVPAKAPTPTPVPSPPPPPSGGGQSGTEYFGFER
jgi:hypothetical protein